MSEIKQEYIKNKEGEIISPITSIESVYWKDGEQTPKALSILINGLKARQTLFVMGSQGVKLVIDQGKGDKFPIEVTIVHNNAAVKTVSRQIIRVFNGTASGEVILNPANVPANQYAFTTNLNSNSKGNLYFNNIGAYSHITALSIPGVEYYFLDVEKGTKSTFY